MRLHNWIILCLIWICLLDGIASLNVRESKAMMRSLYSKKRGKERSNLASKLSGEYVPDVGPWSSDMNEPTCEQLREMWRQSKRHSRAAETTNEIPQYADPFARGMHSYVRQLKEGEWTSTVRPRSERRPVVYGRLRHTQSEDTSDKPRPFDVLRSISLNGQTASKVGSSTSSGDLTAAAVLLSEDDKSPFTSQGPARGSFQHLRELVREEQAREQPTRSESWEHSDIGRIVTSPNDHKYSLYSMQGDAPYNPTGQRPFEVLRHHRWRIAEGKPRRTDNRDLLEAELLLRQQDESRRESVQHQAEPRHGQGRSPPKRLRHVSDSSPVAHFKSYSRPNDRQWSDYSSRREEARKTQGKSSCFLIEGLRCSSHSDCRCPSVKGCHRGQCLPKRMSNSDDWAKWDSVSDISDGSWLEDRQTIYKKNFPLEEDPTDEELDNE